jgi:hypothetical protein
MDVGIVSPMDGLEHGFNISLYPGTLINVLEGFPHPGGVFPVGATSEGIDVTPGFPWMVIYTVVAGLKTVTGGAWIVIVCGFAVAVCVTVWVMAGLVSVTVSEGYVL